MENNKVFQQPLILNESNSNRKENDYTVFVNSDRMNNSENNHSSLLIKINQFNKNKISTSKYTWINCAPKIILEQI
jgi:hypothetical protein